MAPYRSEDTTYRELLNAGELGLIRNEALRDALAMYYITGVCSSGRGGLTGHCPDRLVNPAGYFVSAASIPARRRVGEGGHPGTTTSTGITFETAPQLA